LSCIPKCWKKIIHKNAGFSVLKCNFIEAVPS
jgi:hypothetical protein